MKNDIENLEHIQQLVNTFYGKVQHDDLIGGIFTSTIKDWPTHLEKMYRFWQTVLLEQHTYNGAPFAPHARMPVDKAHFERWLKLWYSTVDEFFEGPKAEEAKWRGERMAVMFLSKITYFRNQDSLPLA